LPIGSLKVHMAYTANAMVYKSAQGTAGHCQERPGSLGIMGPGSEHKGVLYSNLCWLFEGVMINRDFPCCSGSITSMSWLNPMLVKDHKILIFVAKNSNKNKICSSRSQDHKITRSQDQIRSLLVWLSCWYSLVIYDYINIICSILYYMLLYMIILILLLMYYMFYIGLPFMSTPHYQTPGLFNWGGDHFGGSPPIN